ncbi:MAG TPA: metallophosphoesterase [Jatrophihabitantaceae bacterium]|nr:metallophosphoesterase [Jatrophihabitantaceae bacterium]
MADRISRVVDHIRSSLDNGLRALRERPASVARASAEFVLRWALRIALPVAGAAAMLTLFPYRATAGGAHFRVQGSVLTRPSLSADTSFGSWVFPHVDGLPVGVHISPLNVDLVKMAGAASADPQAYADRLRDDLVDQLPAITAWLVGEMLIGVALGLGVAAAINLAVRQVRNRPRRERELRRRLRQFAAACAVLVVVALIGALTYQPDWARRSRVNGTLATLQLFPDQLDQYYDQRAKALDVLSAIAAIQSSLQQRIERTDQPATAFNIMFISDMHLGTTYPLVAQYAKSFDVKLIVNTGDEAEFGTRAEMTPTYLDQLRDVTKVAPMIWLAGNHDSPDTIAAMRTIPNLTVLGTKKRVARGEYLVGGQDLNAYGLTIGAVPDPRVYGATGEFGAENDATVNPLEQRAVDTAVSAVSKDHLFDIFATHEPVAVAPLLKDLPGQIRQTVAGHKHKQNSDSNLQNGSTISLVEGSTGAGGLDQLNRGLPPTPIEFSIESVAADCQFTKLVRFQITGTAPSSAGDVTSDNLPQVAASTLYLRPQKVGEFRRCDTTLGLSRPGNL